MNEDRVREGLEHVQAAARETIAAVRAFLDVAEELVDDPEVAAAVASAITTLASTVRAAGTRSGPEPVDDSGRVQRIRVS